MTALTGHKSDKKTRKVRLTLEYVKRFRSDETDVSVWDKSLPGFYLRSRDGRKTYGIMYRVNGTLRRKVFGRTDIVTLDAARRSAKQILGKAAAGKDVVGDRRSVPEIRYGLDAALKLSRCNERTQADHQIWINYFIRWLGERHPRVRRWSDMRPSMLEAFVREHEKAGKSFDTIRIRLQIVKMAWRRQHRDCPEFVLPLPEVRIRRQQRREIQCLESAEVSILLDWLKAHRPNLWPMACLQALAGLRMYEAAYLRAEDVDLKAGTITITETPYHKPKTEQSHRTIPLCSEALAALEFIMTKGKVRAAAGELFHDAKGNIWKPNALSRYWQRTLRAAGAAPVRMIRKDGKPLTVDSQGAGVSRLSEIPARKLRAFFATTASRLGASDHALRG